MPFEPIAGGDGGNPNNSSPLPENPTTCSPGRVHMQGKVKLEREGKLNPTSAGRGSERIKWGQPSAGFIVGWLLPRIQILIEPSVDG